MTRRPRPPGLPSANTSAPDLGGRAITRRPTDRFDLAGVDLEDSDVQVGIGPGDASCLRPSVGEAHRDLVVAQIVRVREHATGRDHDARAHAPSSAEPDDRRPVAAGGLADGRFKFLQDRHACSPINVSPGRSRGARSPPNELLADCKSLL